MEKFAILIQNIAKLEPKKISPNFTNISPERYNYLVDVASKVKYSYEYLRNNLNDNKYNIITIMDRYEFILRNFQLEDNQRILYNIEVSFENNAEKELFMVLFADPQLQYLTYYQKINDGINLNDIKNEIGKMYGFYSMIFLRMELHTFELTNKISMGKENKNGKPPKRS